jgi:DNA-binding beta-propeller fold protein YncE
VLRPLVVSAVTVVLWGALAMTAYGGGIGSLSSYAGPEACVSRDALDGDEGAGPCNTGRAITEITGIEISPDGKFVYGASTNPAHAISVFARDATNGGLTQLSGTDACVSESGLDENDDVCADGRGLTEVKELAISPDGENLYAVGAGSGESEGALTTFDRDQTTGVITQKDGPAGCVQNGVEPIPQEVVLAQAIPDCGYATALSEPTSVTVTPDGRHVYVTGSGGGSESIVAFERNPDTGELTRLPGDSGCVSWDGGDGISAEACEFGRAMFEPTDVVVSADGRHVYVAASEARPNDESGHGPGAVVAFARDQETGELDQLPLQDGCVSVPDLEAGCAPGRGHMDALSITMSTDNRFVYLASQGEDTINIGVGAVSVFARNGITGGLTQAEAPGGCISENGGDGSDGGAIGEDCATGRAMIEPSGVAVSPDGVNLYASGGDDASVVIFRPDSQTGQPNQPDGTDGCIRSDADAIQPTSALNPDPKGCTSGRALGGNESGLLGPRSIVVSPDCNFVYASSPNLPGIAVMRRGCTPPASSGLPACSTSSDIPISITDAAGGVKEKVLHYRLDGGAEQTVPTPVGNPASVTLTIPEGTHSLEYWGEDEMGVSEAARTAAAVIDRTNPKVTIAGPGNRTAFTQGETAAARVAATDENSGLATDPSGSVALDTKTVGAKTITRTAVDRCRNTTTTTFSYRVDAAGELPAALRSCASRRNFFIHLREPAKSENIGRLKSAVVKVNGKRVKVLTGNRLRSRVNLRGLPKGRFTVTIRAVTTTGRVIKETRRYRTCTPKRKPRPGARSLVIWPA